MDYKRHYGSLIERAKSRDILSGYTEKHHILPKCLGGTNKKDNLVRLTASEHFLAHQLLTKIYPECAGIHASAFMMSCESNKKYSWLKNKWSKIAREKALLQWSDPEHRIKISKLATGRIVSEATKKKLSESLTSYFSDSEARKKVSQNTIRQFSDPEQRNKMSGSVKKLWEDEKYCEKLRGRKRTDDSVARIKEGMSKQPIRTCPYCGIIGKGGNMTRYHFDNCKNNTMLKGALHAI